jgi:Xaa-Pro aminopeptidase
MTPVLRAPFASRLASVRNALGVHGVDALLVTHPPNLRYLTGFRGTAGAALISSTRAMLVVDFRYLTAAHELVASTAELSSFEIVLAERGHDETLAAIIQESGLQRTGIEAASMPVSRFNKLSSVLASGAPTPLNASSPCPVLVSTERVIEQVRVIKDAFEVAVMREAAALLSGVAAQVAGFARPGRTELEVAADIDAALRRAGFERPAFDTIVAAGPNAALPHARPGARVLQPGDGVVLDFGGIYDGYCVDLTRTVQLAPTNPQFRRIFGAVAEAHAAAVAAVKPGVKASAIDGAARAVLARYGLAEAFGHGTGHGLGLEVHEAPRISRSFESNADVAVEPGMIFTIEPGVYVPGTGGVRIEDDVLVVAEGCELLTRVPIEI